MVESMVDLTEVSVADLLLYAPYVVGGAVALPIVWKLGKGLYKFSNSFASNPKSVVNKTLAGASLFATPVAYYKCMETDPGFALGSVLLGGFVFLSNMWSLTKNTSDRPTRGNEPDIVKSDELLESYKKQKELEKANIEAKEANEKARELAMKVRASYGLNSGN